MLDWFLGYILPMKIEVTDDLVEFAGRKAGEYLMTHGGTPSWDEWCLLSDVSKEAFKTALGDIAIRKALTESK